MRFARAALCALLFISAVTPFAQPTLAASSTAQGPASVAALAKQLSPAVVNIGTSRHVPGGPGLPFPQGPDGSQLDDMLDHLNPNDGLGPEVEQEAESLGSGFIIKADGLIVTNNHVIDGAEEIQVFLTDGTRLPAKVIGTDAKTDLAVLKVDAGRELPFVEFGDSDTAEVGDWVMAIGNPFGLGGSVTLGIVSARNRDINSGPYDNFIQTDAAINQGNSGGPLFDMDGKVVGINTALLASGGSSIGIGFAVAINLAKPVIDQLVEYGETRRGWLGVGIQEVTDDIAASLGRHNTNGALVVDVTEGGPSDGVLKEGDLILQFDNKPIERMRDLPRIVAETDVGKAVEVKILRNGKDETVKISLGRLEVGEQQIAEAQQEQQPPPPPDAPEDNIGPAPGLPELVGFEAGPLSPEVRKQYGIPDDVKGVIITSVTSKSDAEEKGMIPGLVVSEVNQQPIETVADVVEMVSAAKEAGRPAVLFKVTDATMTSRFIAVRVRN
ncbi:Do family serine endopeptidase [Paradevosia shaoguanensis]|uniref:Do family serine endopeptidase n=1 Tax=Paradevosia shaoguanensis TaxID=1335043 RepID=UPI003C711750